MANDTVMYVDINTKAYFFVEIAKTARLITARGVWSMKIGLGHVNFGCVQSLKWLIFVTKSYNRQSLFKFCLYLFILAKFSNVQLLFKFYLT